MTTKVKEHYSLLWKSLMVVRDLGGQGMWWKVGNEENINIWEDKWLPSRLTFQIQSPTKILPSSATVNELLMEGGTEWNIKPIQSIFLEEETKAILSIPLEQNKRKYKPIWALIDKGTFYVKSAYFLTLDFKGKE